MSKVRKFWLLVACAVLLGVIGMHGLGPNTAQATPGSAPVTVINTPLPVQGTVNAAQSGTWNVGLTGTPAVSAAQSGPWNVGITSIPGVTVANANSQPVPTLTAGASLVTHMGQLPSNHVALSTGSVGCATWSRIAPNGLGSDFTIPAGEDLVITDVEFNSPSFPPGSYDVGLKLSGSGVLASGAVVDASGLLFTQQHLTSGVVTSVLPTCDAGPSNPTPAAHIQGYLIPAS